MALESLSHTIPEIALESDFHPIRQYALGRGPLTFLPFALGESKGKIGIGLVKNKIEGSNKPVFVSLISFPVAMYAVQLSDHENLLPLRSVSELFNMIFDEHGTRTCKLHVNLGFEYVSSHEEQAQC